MGKFHRACGPGMPFMLPFLDRKRPFLDHGKMVDYVDLRERTLEIPRQRIATEDHGQVEIDIIVSYSISDPIKAVYRVEDLSAAIRQRMSGEFRYVMHACPSTDIDNKQEAIVKHVGERLHDTSDEWGIIIRRIVFQHTAFV
jgi:regulator of protease activity HflC (stomatin/prohibitin superfamily)